jgi:hypothetical protein
LFEVSFNKIYDIQLNVGGLTEGYYLISSERENIDWLQIIKDNTPLGFRLGDYHPYVEGSSMANPINRPPKAVIPTEINKLVNEASKKFIDSKGNMEGGLFQVSVLIGNYRFDHFRGGYTTSTYKIFLNSKEIAAGEISLIDNNELRFGGYKEYDGSDYGVRISGIWPEEMRKVVEQNKDKFLQEKIE